MSDGVPTPTLTWYNPDCNEIKKVTATQNAVNVKMKVDQDFGGYKCVADNGLTSADYKLVKIEQISKCCLSLLTFLGIQTRSPDFAWGGGGGGGVHERLRHLIPSATGASSSCILKTVC